MAQLIKQADIFGRLGTGAGKGLAEQIPKEIEHNRFASGLQQLERDAPGLNPQQYYTRALQIRGLADRPQLVQSLGDFARQQAKGQALSQMPQGASAQPQPFPFPQRQPEGPVQPSSNIPSITREDELAQIQKGYTPPTQDQIIQEAGRLYTENPALYGNNPEKAIEAAETAEIRKEKIFEAAEKRNRNLTQIQDNVVSRLDAQSKRLNTQVPADFYSRIEDEAIEATKSKEQGGRGLTEQQAMKEYGDKLNDASRLFAKVRELTGWGVLTRPAKATITPLNQLQSEFEKMGETDNFAKSLISEKITPKLAYAMAQPVSRVPGLSKAIKTLPRIPGIKNLAQSKLHPEKVIPATLEVAPRLAKFVKDNDKASPLAIAYELEASGYDPQTWLQYLVDNGSKLNLRQRQSEQAATAIDTTVPWNDWWLSEFTGVK